MSALARLGLDNNSEIVATKMIRTRILFKLVILVFKAGSLN
jgi:hypothetical protein